MTEWIAVEERLPERNRDEFGGIFSETVHLFDNARNHWLGFYSYGGTWGESPVSSGWWIHQGLEDDYGVEDDPLYSITHWMPLPEPPK